MARMGMINVFDHNYRYSLKSMVRSGKRLRFLVHELIKSELIVEKLPDAPCDILKGISMLVDRDFEENLVFVEQLRVHIQECPKCLNFMETLINIARKQMGKESILHPAYTS